MIDKLPPKVLVIETDEVLRTTLSNTIERNGFTVYRAGDYETAAQECARYKPNVVIISARIQGITPIEMATKIKSLKNFENIPIVFILDSNQSTTSYQALNLELVEYVYRPFSPSELMTGIKSLLRRSKPVFQDKILKFKDMSMDLSTYSVYRGKRKIHIGPTEFRILQMLLEAPTAVFSRNHIIEFIWGAGANIEYRTVDVHVNRLRKLIKDPADYVPFIKTIRSEGYSLSLPSRREGVNSKELIEDQAAE